MKRHTVSFKHAIDGVLYAVKTQPNFRIHLVAAIVVSLSGVYFHISTTEWLFLIFTFIWVITAEMINTALESVVDLLSPERQEAAKIAKDTAAGMVLLSAIGAVVIGLIIFCPYLCRYF